MTDNEMHEGVVVLPAEDGDDHTPAVAQQQATFAVMGEGPDPEKSIAYQQKVAENLTRIIGDAKVRIGNKEHLLIEAWQSLGAATGHSCEILWTRPVEGIEPNDRGVRAWEARAVVKDQFGNIVAAAEQMADPSEGKGNRKVPWGENNYSVRGMCQTRAASRALSMRLRYIVALAGMSGTPAEEIQPEPEPVVDPKQLARERYKMLSRIEGLDVDVLKEAVGTDKQLLDSDQGALVMAFKIGQYMGQYAVREDKEPATDGGEAGPPAEAEPPSPDAPNLNQSQMRRLHAVAKDHGLDHDALRAVAAATCGINSMTELRTEHVDPLLAALEAVGTHANRQKGT